mmetsp:Transcript_13734/g.31709  ORF Transcript_13734/g.31709 Transcript_13734/m.31709 type:complete len:507 (-) Transcript_13734:912-2432(-)
MFHIHNKTQQPLKFEVTITTQLMTQLPAKYKHLRLMLTRGAKAVSTKEIFAVNQRAEPSPSDGVMKMVCTMYKSTQTGKFDEKTYKISLIRINPRAMREKEKRIGTTYLNLADYVNTDPRGLNEDVKLTMKVSESNSPAMVSLNIKSLWLKNFKGGSEGDAMSDMSSVNIETSSQATTNTSLNSIDEDGEEEANVEIKEEDETPEKPPKSAKNDMLSPTASAAVGGDIQELKDALLSAKADLQWTSENLKDTEKLLMQKEEELEEAMATIRKLESDLEAAMKVQEELLQENERAEKQYVTLMNEFEAGVSKSSVEKSELERLKAEIKQLKSDASALREERDSLQRQLQDEKTNGEALRREEEKKGNADTAELESLLEHEKQKSAKYKSHLEKMTEAKGSLEAELAQIRKQVEGKEPVAKSKMQAEEDLQQANGDGQSSSRQELEKMAAELERVSMQLVTASLGHAQAEQDRLEAKQQVYKLKEANRKLRERLTQAELELAKAHTAD